MYTSATSSASLSLTTGSVSRRTVTKCSRPPRKRRVLTSHSHSSRRRSAHRSKVTVSSSEDDPESDLARPRKAVG